MFTGIIEEIGRIERVIKSGSMSSISISCNKVLDDIKLGDSIAVNGICLTVNSFDNKTFTADVMPVTFQKSNLSKCRMGEEVNLERALQLKSRLGGHLVSGHIDGIGEILSVQKQKNSTLLEISINTDQIKFLIPEGSISIDGISFTIADLKINSFLVSIIPETMKKTIMQNKKVGDFVNLESDIIGKYLYNFLQKKEKKDISLTFLKENGFA
ncbi:MAG: riboflavin synthase [Candidatus Cloacimonetes bacterium]|nr:riboflavin synthase [Candidatus Cloacimonadota bacterium]MCF7867955.1 riboflavin synthase [Candidatus Cloacimonadota bacterium]MCF7883413.1 riboflavin synthase [Candidatus Cloacimonadota bacterium]